MDSTLHMEKAWPHLQQYWQKGTPGLAFAMCIGQRVLLIRTDWPERNLAVVLACESATLNHMVAESACLELQATCGVVEIAKSMQLQSRDKASCTCWAVTGKGTSMIFR